MGKTTGFRDYKRKTSSDVPPLERIEKDTDRDNFMTAEEARDYGLIDVVLERMPTPN